MGISDRLHDIVDPICTELDLELVDLEYAGAVVRVTIDRPGGIDMEAIAKVTRAVSRAFDEHDPIAGRFTLEVSSPGLERPLRTPEHFARSVGEVVALKVRAGVEGDRRVKGTLVAVDDDGITVAPAGAEPGATRRLAFDDLDKARTVFEWGPAPKPGGPKAPGTTPSPSAKKKAAKS